ncbi:hypothetical protein [Nonomuraea sp. SBT364]|uniref:hypothetical protein n=1 Tax=Nonomuraea sp. SBT364 TaxID=1580530 RepID=UPI00066B20EE|nr:hypothetical protein [Nonomuraea sp. SBT364]
MGSRSAISAGVLAMALAAVPLAAPPALAADCERGSGLLSGVTDSLCGVVEAVTGTVDQLTGGLTEPVTDGLDKTTDTVLGTVGKVVPTGRPRASARPSGSPKPTAPAKPKATELLPETLEQVCLPVLACDEQGVLGGLTTPTPTTGPRDPGPGQPSDERRRRREDTTRVPAEVATAPPRDTVMPPDSHPHLIDSRQEPVRDEPSADPEDFRIDLLWPNPFAEELGMPADGRRVVRPSAPASDVLGTALTIILLATAVLATRIVQQRRHRSEQSETIPFEPARGNGHHRLA